MKIVVTSIPDNDGHLVAYRIENRQALWHALKDLDAIEENDNSINSQNYHSISEVEWEDFIESFETRGSFQIQQI